MLDPQMIFDRDGGRLIDLKEFTAKETIGSNYECFHDYFGYKGSHQYNGTIFRFPLRTGGYETKLSNTIYNPAEVLTSLFTPFKCEIENCLLFMKSVNKITVSVKSSSGTEILYSAEVSDKFRDGLAMHREEIFQFVRDEHYLSSTQIYISVFPIHTMDTEQRMRLWVVINMLGFGVGNNLKSSHKKQPDCSYLPWFATALPLPHNQNTITAIDNVFCWSVEYTDFPSAFQFLQSLPCISISNVVENFVRNLFCFLPIATNSNFPFHIHGYFALATDRRAIKWPRHDDLSDEARWNRDLVEDLGTVCYAVLVYLMVSRVRSDEGNMFHYDLWRCNQTSNDEDQLECVLHRKAFEFLQNTELVWSITGRNWVKLETGYYLPSVVNTGCIPHENICRSLLLLLQQPLIDVPHSVANSIVGYEFLKNKVINRIVDPTLIRSLLIRFKDDLMSFLKNQKNVCCLLEIVLSDVDFSANNINTTLQHIPLIPVCNSEVPMEFGSQKRYFISEGPQDYLKIFPGLVSSFIKIDLPSHTHQSLLSLSRKGQVNIEDVTNLSNKPIYFVSFLECSMKAYFNLDTNVVWRPNTSRQPDKSWIESVWKLIDQNRGIIHAIQNKELPILPKQSLTSTQIELLPLSTTHMPYIQHNSGHDYSKIEKLLTECGCHVCHHHVFILPFQDFVYNPIPQGLFSILQQHQLIQQTFIQKLSQADDSIKLAVIDIIMSTTLIGQEINIAKSFSIFRSISNNWIRINTFYPHYIPPDSLPRDFTDYPNTFLSPYDVTNTDLCMKLRIARISITQSVQLLLPLITKNAINRSQNNILSLWILRNISQLDNELINILQTSKWILDSSKSICAPQQLYDPTDEIFKQLIPSKEQQGIFPDSFYDRQISSLRSLGLLTSQTISYQNLEYIIRVTLRNVSQVRNDGYINWINSLVDLVSLHMDRLNLTQRPNFWRIFHQTAFILPSTRDQCTSYPRSLPYYNSNSCLYPRNVIFCNEKESSLVAGVTPVFIENSYQTGKQRTVCTKMGMPHNIPVNLVCLQLTLITKQTCYNHNEVHSLVKKIYKYFANIILFKGDSKSINLPRNFVFIPDYGFFSTEHVVMSCDAKFFPHIFSLSKHYPTYEDSLANFFKAFNIDIEVGMTKCIFVLNKLNTSITLSVENASLACKLIQLIGELLDGDYRDDILMLAQDNRLYLAVECVFNDLTWLNRSELSTNKPIVHRNISNIIASKLGCKPASIELVPTAESISYSFLTAAGQTEDLVDRLRGILEGYRMSADVFNELIQNSDDAGASCVKVLFDYTSHPATTVLQKNMEEIHGPAMYVFNNAKFTERDFESILKLSSCNKLSDTEKIGRFGVGFNAVYNFTDCPSFVSGDSVQIFDPLQKYVSKLSNAAGIRLRFANDATAVTTFTDQFRVYQDIFSCDILNRQEYNHTLFRLPFRLKRNKLSSKTYNEDRIKQLQSSLMDEISNFIQFLQNIHCIEIYERKHSNIPMKLLLSVTKDDCTTTHFLQNHKEYFKSYKNQLNTGIRPPIQTSADKLTVYTDYHGKKANTSKSYLIAYASGVGDCYDVMRRFDVDKITFLPLCGVAFPLDFLQKTPEDLLCKIYTFLPLPIKSPLCLNINCYFSLTDSRKHLNDAFVGDGITSQKDILTDWNLALINDALSNALICALEELHTLCLFCENISLVSNYYSIWPVKENNNILWKRFPEHFARKVVELFPATKLFLSAHTNAWISFQDISFLTLENNLIQNTEFTKFVYELSFCNNIIFANIPDSFYSSAIFKIFSKLAPEKIFNLQKLCGEIIFQRLHILPLHSLILIFSTLVPLCSDVSNYTWLFNKLTHTEFIPCGSGGDNITLRKPRDVVCPNTRLSTLYQPEEMRIPVPEMNDLFAFDQPTQISNVLKRMCVIYDKLPEEEVLSRCEITSNLSVEKATSHAIILIEYLDTLDKTTLKSINHLVKDIPFVPTYHDELFDILQIPLKHFVAPIECYKFHCHHLVTPLFPAASNIFTCLSLIHSPKIDVVFQVLHYLISKVALIAQHNIVIQEKVLQIYKFLSEKESQLDEVKHILSNCQWIWHPSNKQFYASNQVILSHSQSLPDNTYLVNFPYMETISKDSKLKSFLINVGIKEKINDETIIACIDRINNNEVNPLPDNLIQLILKLIQFISCHEDCADTIYILSKNNTLKRPNQLFIPPLSVLKDVPDDSSIYIHDSINANDAFKLGVKLYEALFSSESDINEEDFGIEEEITDRIQTLVRELPVESLIKELIQNAEDSGATEIVFILDEQDYSSHNKTLILCPTAYPNWKRLHSFPSLTVFNNKGFSEEDIKGIQKLSVGGKINDQNTIGKFGLGFNSVYHITDAPSFITHQQNETGLHFCCFDPFLKYTTDNLRRKDVKKRGKRFCIKLQDLANFKDQFFPFTFDQFRHEPILSCLSCIGSHGDFSMFRFPLDIDKFPSTSDILESSVHTKHVSYRKVESRKHCSMKDVETMLIKQIEQYSEILLFLKNVKSLKVLKIDKFTRKVTLLCSQSNILKEDRIPRPIWFPAGNNQDIIVQKMESTSVTNQSIMKTLKWLIYIHPEISIEEYVRIDNTMSDHSKNLIEEKLWGFGGIAVCISSRDHCRQSHTFNFLPVGATANFPVHINAPLFTDSSRQNVHYEQSELSKAWHNSVIHNILSPLYTLLLVELRSPIVPVLSLDEKLEYYNWFYSLFPSTSTSKIKFVSDFSEQMYNFLYMTNQAIFLAHNLDISDNISWCNLHGPDCGILLPNSFFPISKVPEQPPHPQVFKFPVDTPYKTDSLKVSTEKEDEIRRSLIKINLPLTFAPLVLKERFKDNKITQLDQTLLLTYLNENLNCLFQDTDSPRNLTSSILSFKQLETILEYVLTAEPKVFDTCDIPIRIDIHGNFQCFQKSEQCFRSTYAALLPHFSEIFISTDYSLEIIIELLNLHFVEDFNVKFLAEHISINEFEDISICCPLFWKFVSSKHLPVKELKASFGIHQLVPLSSYIQSTPIQFFPINKLEFIVSPTLNENDSILYSALSKLRCPILDGNYIKLTLSYLDTIVISRTQTSEVIINSISLSDDVTADLETDEMSKLLKILDQVRNHQFDPNKIPLLCSLKIFETQSGEFNSLSQCEKCYINDVNLNLGPVLLVELLRNNQLVIFVNNYSKLITSLCRQARKPLLNVSELLSQMIFPLLYRIPVEEQKNIVVFISQNIDGRNNLKHLIDTLANINIAFVMSDDGRKLRFNQFYSPEMLFFTKFLSHTTLPKIWRDDNIRFLINKLGLRQEVSIKDIHDVIVMFSQEKFPSSDLPELFVAFKTILSNIDYSESLNITILQQIAEIQFLRVWRIDRITNPKEVSHFPYLARFCDAKLLEFQNCCCTISWIHSIDFTLPTTCYLYLGISERPDISTVKEHLIKIIDQITQVHPILDIPTCYKKYFLESYNILEKYISEKYQSADVSLTELNTLHCILWDMKLYCPINMLINSNEILLPFVIQLPATLAGKFPKFFKQIGVEETATYRHFALVLMEIAALLQRLNEELSKSDYLQQTEKVFNSFITALRTFEKQNLPFNLDLNQTLLLTRDCRLISSPEVIFADNLSLLSRVNEIGIAVNILRPLEPDENKSCIPPNCLRLNKLTQLISEELDPNVLLNNTIPPTYFSQILQRTLNCPVVLRCMRRLYFHLTKKDLENLFLNNGETCFSDDSSPPPGFQPFSQILNRLRVVSVTYINTIITDKRQTPHIPYPLDDSCSCYIDETTNTFLIAEKNSSTCLQKDIAFTINSYLGGIFTNVLSNFELCFMLEPYKIMRKLDEYNIDADLWPIPQQPPPSPPVSSDSTCDSYVAPTHLYSTPRLRTHPQPGGVSIGEPDLPAAKLWFMIAQCDVIAAKKLVNQTADCVNVFPSHACFFCFESVTKVFTALLHFKGSKERLDSKHNLRVHIDRLRFLIPEDVCTEIEELTIPLMNYDIDTRIPNSTLVRCIPQQLISLEQSREAIRNAECIITLVTEKFSVMREMKLDSNDPIFRCLPSAQPTLITAVLRCKLFVEYYKLISFSKHILPVNSKYFNLFIPIVDVGRDLKKVKLETGDEEFKAIARCFQNSMPYWNILSIEKVFNPNSWNSFKEKLILESNRNPVSCLSVCSLFHGSGDTSPQFIINDPEGFNMRFAQRGLWGRGLYFATNCSYSHKFTHVVRENVFSVFVATVFVGYVKEMNEDRNITTPPIRPNGRDRYHSVQGRKHGEVIHIIYKNCMAYPSHLITYSNPNS